MCWTTNEWPVGGLSESPVPASAPRVPGAPVASGAGRVARGDCDETGRGDERSDRAAGRGAEPRVISDCNEPVAAPSVATEPQGEEPRQERPAQAQSHRRTGDSRDASPSGDEPQPDREFR